MLNSFKVPRGVLFVFAPLRLRPTWGVLITASYFGVPPGARSPSSSGRGGQAFSAASLLMPLKRMSADNVEAQDRGLLNGRGPRTNICG